MEILRDIFLPHPQFRMNAFLCLDAIATKRMVENPGLKLEIVTQTLRYPEILERLIGQYSSFTLSQLSSVDRESELNFYVRVAESVGWLERWCLEDIKEGEAPEGLPDF